MSGGGSKSQTVGYRYYLGLHFGVCSGPVDALIEIRAGDRTAWNGQRYTAGTSSLGLPIYTPTGTPAPSTANERLVINAPELFGGEEKEGGILGEVDVMFGEADQVANDYLTSKQGAPQPAYRGILGLVLRQAFVAANNPYVKPWAFKVRRILKGWQNGAVWYSAKAAIDLPNGAKGMNPAHIVYECLTNQEWGLGYGGIQINDARFRAAADTFHAEGLGLCLIWTKQEQLERFIQAVVDHAGAVMTQDPTTGQFVLDAIRANYDPNTLPVFDPSNIIELESFQRAASPEATNELTVQFVDVQTGKKGSVTLQNLAGVTSQGGIVSQTKSYPGIPTAELALRVAARDLSVLSATLSRVRLRANREAYQLLPGGLFRLNWPKLGLVNVVMRVGRVNRGTLTGGQISIEAVEDVFGLPAATYAAQQPPGWTDPSTEPAPATMRVVEEASFYEVQRTLGTAGAVALPNDSGFVAAAASRPSNDSFDFGLFTRVGTAAYAEASRGSFCPSATLVADIDYTATSCTVQDGIDLELVALNSYAKIDDEIVRVDSFNRVTGALTIGRGVLDTVAAPHLADARIYFLDGFVAGDETERVDGEAVNVKLRPRTGRGQLSEADAPTDTVTMDSRAARPYPPGRMRINSLAYPATVTSPLSIAWAHRSRTQQNLEGDETGNIGPETGTTYTVQIRNPDTDELLVEQVGISGTVFSPTAFYGNADVRVKLWSVRAGLESRQRHDFVFAYDYELPNTIEAMHSIRQVGDHAFGVRARSLPSPAVRPINSLGQVVGGGGIAFFSGQITQIASTSTEIFVAFIDGSNPSFVRRYTVSGSTMTLAGQYNATTNADCFGVAVGGGFAWALGSYSGTIKKLNQTTMAVEDSISAPLGSRCLVYDAATASLFACDPTGTRVVQINPASGAIIRSFSTGSQPFEALVTAEGALFAASTAGIQVFRVSDGALLRTISPAHNGGLADQFTRGIAEIGGGEVVCVSEDVVRYLDATTGEDTRSTGFGAARQVSGYGAGRLWLMLGGASSSTVSSTITRLVRVRAELLAAGGGVSGTAAGATFTVNTLLIGGSATAGDAFPSNVALLLHCDGTNGSTSFPDSSSFARTVTPSGAAQVSTAQSKFGGASAAFNGSSGYLQVAASSDFTPGVGTGGSTAGDYTIEFWAYLSGAQPSGATFFSNGFGSFIDGARAITIENVRRLKFLGNSSGVAIYIDSGVDNSFPIGQWVHVALCRNQNVTRLFQDGTQVGASNTVGEFMDFNAGGPIIGSSGWGGAAAVLNGYIDEFRYTKGVARYTANFTPPTEAYPNPSNTWSPTQKTAGWTLSGGNLTVSETTSAYESIRSVTGKSSGKWYWELLIDSVNDGNGTDCYPGIRRSDTAISTQAGAGNDAIVRSVNGNLTGSGGPTPGTGGVEYPRGSIMMIALDLDTGKMWFGKNGTWNNSGNPVAGTNATFTTIPAGTWHAYCGTDNNAPKNIVTANFGGSAFTYTPPTGFSAFA